MNTTVFLTFRGPCIEIYLMIKANEMNYFSSLFGKELYMFRTDLLSIIRSLNTVFTALVFVILVMLTLC